MKPAEERRRRKKCSRQIKVMVNCRRLVDCWPQAAKLKVICSLVLLLVGVIRGNEIARSTTSGNVQGGDIDRPQHRKLRHASEGPMINELLRHEFVPGQTRGEIDFWPSSELVARLSVGQNNKVRRRASDKVTQDNNSTSKRLKCRVEADLYLDFEEYRHYTCANCYNQVPPEYFTRKLRLDRSKRIVRLYDQEARVHLWTNETRRVGETFKDGDKFDKWLVCCSQAVACCHQNAAQLPTTRDPESQQLVDDPERRECPGTWDGLSCWPASPAGQLAWRVCPRVAYLLDFEPACRGYVTKQCFPNASWFINRNDHEWSDYSTCSPEGLYKARMLHASVAYVCESLIVIPALLIIGKFPNRGGNKRIRIMKSLLFYILLNSLIQALQRGLLAAGFFAEYRGPSKAEAHHPQSLSSAASIVSMTSSTQSPPLAAGALVLSANVDRLARASMMRRTQYDELETTTTTTHERENALIAHIYTSADSHHHQSPARNLTAVNGSRHESNVVASVTAHFRSTPTTTTTTTLNDTNSSRATNKQRLGRLGDDIDTSSANSLQHVILAQPNGDTHRELKLAPPPPPPPPTLRRYKRAQQEQNQTKMTSALAAPSPSGQQPAKPRRNESAWKAFFCWLLQMASRLVRLMGYAWMFTGGVYLCSALHFAPAEPPVRFIKILFFLTNAFPNLIFFAYVTARTINEPSPLNIILKVPYYWLQGDEQTVERLYATQKVCWFEESKSERIEAIADMPNLILVGLNVFLFVITLVILCRINRPGSTRPDMSPCAYFKAAGTLLFLYGGHYFFLAYRPESESCSVDTFMFYAFICIDVVQGIAISIVFCYMTQEGKVVIAKYWRTRQRYLLVRQCTWLGCLKDKDKFADNGYHHTSVHLDSRFNQSTRSNNSGCNGHNDNLTELININDTQASGAF